MNTSEIENILRQAPRPVAPAGLKDKLLAQAPVARHGQVVATRTVQRAPGSWLARWWPALAPAAASLACAAVMTFQRVEIQELRSRQAPPPNPIPESQPAVPEQPSAPVVAPANSAASEQAEIARLKTLAEQLATDVSRLEKIAAQNEKLRKQLASAAGSVLAPEETKALEEARDKAMSITCVNQLKQLGLAARVWGVDHGDVTPASVLQMTNEMNTPKVLVCPADTGRQVASNWASFSSANVSYEYLAPSAPDHEPFRVLFRCPIHGTIGLVDGSVHMGAAKKHPDWFIQREGRLFYEPTNSP